jgi:hypothetical protein
MVTMNVFIAMMVTLAFNFYPQTTPINSKDLPKVVCLFRKFVSKVPTQIPKQVLPNIVFFFPIHLSIIFPYIPNIETCLLNCENLVSQICLMKCSQSFRQMFANIVPKMNVPKILNKTCSK